MNIKKIKKIFTLLKIPYFTSNLMRGVAASIEHLPILYNLNNIKTIIDIGANKGQFSIAARYVFPNSKIISFEPLITPAKKYCKLFKNDKNVYFYRSAIGVEKKHALINVSSKNDSSSILPIGKKQISIFPGTEKSHTEKIQIAPLTNFIQMDELVGPIFVKIDVQGYELEVLKSCVNIINQFDYIYVECSFIELYNGQIFS